MKRSEMIRFLSRQLICPHKVFSEGTENHYAQRAESLLDELEKLGMLPPVTFKVCPVNAVTKVDTVTNSVTTMTMGDHLVSVNEWDYE